MTTIETLLTDKIGYSLRLANGQSWHIIATDGVKPWVAKLAAVMELKPWNGNGYQKLIFMRRGTDKKSWRESGSSLAPEIQKKLYGSCGEVRGSPVIQTWSHYGSRDVFCEIGGEQGYERDIVRMLLAIYPIFERAQDSGGLTLHAAMLERDGIGVLLAAPGNTGKSTCCIRLGSPWRSLCDDETLVVRDQQRRYMAHPFPTWSDYLLKRHKRTWNTEYHIPVSGIFFMEQAKHDEVLPIGQGEAAVSIHHSAMQMCRRRLYHLGRQDSKSLKLKLFDNACELAKVIPAFKLRVSLKGRFWEKIETVLP